MFGILRNLSVSTLSAGILRCTLLYARFLGVVPFGVKRNRFEGKTIWMADNCLWQKWYSLILRLMLSSWFCYTYWNVLRIISNGFELMVNVLRFTICLLCAVCIIVMQIYYGQSLLRLFNRFLRLFRRVCGLSEKRKDKTGFGGVRELVLLLIKSFCIFHELFCEWPMLFHSTDLFTFSSVLCEMFVGIGAGMVMHSCFVGFLSLGALFADFNSYVRHDLRRKLRALELPHDACPNRRHLRAMGYRLDECFAVYDEIQSVGREFNRLINVPLVISVLVNFSVMAMVSFHAIMFSRTIVSYIWLVVAKLFLDIAILTIAVHGAVSSSRQIRRLGLENCYVSEHNEWHLKLESFLLRLNIYEFRVRPLGLFEVSNELILFFLSGLITYLTFIIQCKLQLKFN
ncbi:putative gustatory receptor 93c [Drosophila tropicalis]|uniref:putative gustatory receptor 93c n=1 Tax=Drosophila tropicalis TaxID=46794 RepID=UPI0035ABE772